MNSLSHIHEPSSSFLPAAIAGAGKNGMAMQRKEAPMQFDWLEDETAIREGNYGDILDAETPDDEYELAESADGHGCDVSQLAHKDGDSGPKNYNTSVSGAYKGVTYERKGGGAIDFQYPKAQTQWKDPVVKRGIDLEDGASKKHHGIRLSGAEEPIDKKDRPQHFSIADRIAGITPTSRTGKWTWHHMPTPYKMDLVDMAVHRKHGHNGGVHIW